MPVRAANARISKAKISTPWLNPLHQQEECSVELCSIDTAANKLEEKLAAQVKLETTKRIGHVLEDVKMGTHTQIVERFAGESPEKVAAVYEKTNRAPLLNEDQHVRFVPMQVRAQKGATQG
jgi:hypothetical protein